MMLKQHICSQQIENSQTKITTISFRNMRGKVRTSNNEETNMREEYTDKQYHVCKGKVTQAPHYRQFYWRMGCTLNENITWLMCFSNTRYSIRFQNHIFLKRLVTCYSFSFCFNFHLFCIFMLMSEAISVNTGEV